MAMVWPVSDRAERRRRKYSPQQSKMKNAPRETQTLHAGCCNAEPKLFAPPQTPFPGRRTAKIQSTGDGCYIYLQTQFGEDRCTQFRVIVVTDPQTRTSTETGPITIHCAAVLYCRSFASAQCNNHRRLQNSFSWSYSAVVKMPVSVL